MPVIESEAWVLVRHPLTESSWIVSFFTRSEGVVRGVAKGGRRVKSQFRGALEPMSRVRVELGGREGRDLLTVRKVELLESSLDLYADWSTASLLMAMAELLERGLPERGVEDDTYRLTGAVLKQLRMKMDPALAWLYFQVWFLRLHGVLPRQDRCSVCNRLLGPACLVLNDSQWFCPDCAAKSAERTASIDEKSFSLLTAVLHFSPEAVKTIKTAAEDIGSLTRVTGFILEDYLGRSLASIPPQ